MGSHRLRVTQRFARPRAEVAAFFGRPENLARLTPPDLRFQLLGDAEEMRQGLRLAYSLRPLFGIRVRWESLITDYRPGESFTDLQVAGPYAGWEHRHRFADVSLDDGSIGTDVTDEVEYQLPGGPLGDAVNALVVRRRLDHIFAYRRRRAAHLLAPRLYRPEPLRVAVAGGSGFVGGAIAGELDRRGESVTVLTHRPVRAAALLPDHVAVRTADVASADSLVPVLRDTDVLVISLAFPNSPMENGRRGHTFEAVDAEGTERLVAAAAGAGVRHVVYISGAGAAPEPARPWFRAKWRAERAVRMSGLAYTIVRPTWVYGPGDVALNRFLSLARVLPFVPLTGSGRQRLAPVFVDDVAALVADAVRSDAARDQIFEIGGPETFTMREIVRVALRVAGLRRAILPGPAALLKLVAWPLQLLPAPPLTPDAVDFINQPAEVDTAPLLARMPLRLTPLADGLATYLTPGVPA